MASDEDTVFEAVSSPKMTTAEGKEFCGWKELPSRAVVAMSESENGCVLWWVGSALYYEISEAGMKTVEDLGLNDAPVGISIWEGQYRTYPCGNPLDGYDYETEPVGKFRAPTDEEWVSIRAGEAPWNEEDWWVTEEIPKEEEKKSE